MGIVDLYMGICEMGGAFAGVEYSAELWRTVSGDVYPLVREWGVDGEDKGCEDVV